MVLQQRIARRRRAPLVVADVVVVIVDDVVAAGVGATVGSIVVAGAEGRQWGRSKGRPETGQIRVGKFAINGFNVPVRLVGGCTRVGRRRHRRKRRTRLDVLRGRASTAGLLLALDRRRIRVVVVVAGAAVVVIARHLLLGDPLLLPELGPPVLEPNLHSSLGQINLHGDFLSRVNVWIVRLLEGSFQFLQLGRRKCGSYPSLLSLFR